MSLKKFKMKILLVSDYFYPFNPGGSEWSVFELSRALKKNFVDSIVVTLNYGAKENEVYRGIKIKRLPFFKKLDNFRKVVNPVWQNNPIFFIASTYYLFKAIKKENPDVIHIHGKFLIPASIIAGFFTGKPVIVSIRDKQLLCSIGRCFFDPNRKKACSFFEYVTNELPWFYKNYVNDKNPLMFMYVFIGVIWTRLANLMIKFFAKRANRIIAISNSQKEYLAMNGFSRVGVIYNTADFSNPKGSFVNKTKAVIFTGKLSKGKGAEILINAAKKVLQTQKVTFLFVGSVDMKDLVKTALRNKTFKKHARFLGSIDHHELNALYKKSSVSVLPSIYPESFGRVALEAISVGTPAIVTNIGGLPEIVEDKKTGRVVSPDSDSLSEAIIDVISNEKTYKENIKKSYLNLKKKFYLIPIQQHIKLYTELTK